MLKHTVFISSIVFIAFAAGFMTGYQSRPQIVNAHSDNNQENILKGAEKSLPMSGDYKDSDPQSPSKPEGKEEQHIDNPVFSDSCVRIVQEKSAENASAGSDCMEYQAQAIQLSVDVLKKDMDALQYPDQYDSQNIQKAITRISGYISPEGHQLLENLILTHEDPAVRAAAVQAVSAPESDDVLMAASQDEDETVRETALLKMTELEKTDGQERIFENLLEDALYSETDEDVIHAALTYFEHYSASADDFLSATYQILLREDLPSAILLSYAETLTEYDIHPDMVQVVLSVPLAGKMEAEDLEMLKNQITASMQPDDIQDM